MPKSIRLNEEQLLALDSIKSFLCDDNLDLFVLRGSAGTGKTTLVADVVAAITEARLSCVLLAPTGRAARILGSKVSQALGADATPASKTIHSEIYTINRVDVFEEANTANDPGLRIIHPLREDEPSVSIFIVDECSMVGDRTSKGDFVQFGSGRLLNDLLTYARVGRSGRPQESITKLLFVGDPAQLPPVGETNSPALSDDYLRTEFGLRVVSSDLATVMRQAEGSAILDRATELRDAIGIGNFNRFSLQPNDRDIQKIDAARAVQMILGGLAGAGTCVAVTYSNSMALTYNQNVRERRWGSAELPMQVGDTLLVNRNSRSSLKNGDLVRVLDLASEAEVVPIGLSGGHCVELRYRDLVVAFRAADGTVIRLPVRALENLLASPNRELSPLEQRALLVHFRQRHPDLKPRTAEFKNVLMDDPYFNAVQVKYGYAMTCHKAQGGEWDRVIVDFNGFSGRRNETFFRWAYTAITRGSSMLAVVNPPEFTPFDLQWQGVASEIASTEAAGDAMSDPDWDRFSFSTATAALMSTHRQLRDLWSAKAIKISLLQHLPYCERYTLFREGRQATIQYHYNGRFEVGRAAQGPGSLTDPHLLDDVLAAFATLTNDRPAPALEPFLLEFLDRLDTALAESSIQRTDVRPMPHRLRVGFADPCRKGAIDFTYKASSTWTSAQEVGGPGRSGGLYEEVQRLMASVSRAS
ncbi:hypothetical protein GCM10022280_18680 [Sphingomonas swuensis]|uniref:UvrD-like helicase C-terminal domain-containing protein n=1 Tax=Sphingomonas swuensis TaxID=977800 RepID=A0ABP7T0A9_9SPHN